MDEEQKEARRKMLAELEGSWDTVQPAVPPESSPDLVSAPRSERPSADVQAALDAAADRLVDSLDPPPVSVPTMAELDDLDELDSGWGADEEEEADEPAPVVPDRKLEKVDPEAYARAQAAYAEAQARYLEEKKARDARNAARRERRKVRLDERKVRQKARAQAAKQKQKTKSRKVKPASVIQAEKEAKAKERAASAAKNEARAKAAREAARERAAEEAADELAEARPARKKTTSSGATKAPPSRLPAKKGLSTNQWMLALALAIFIAAAIFVAVVTR